MYRKIILGKLSLLQFFHIYFCHQTICKRNGKTWFWLRLFYSVVTPKHIPKKYLGQNLMLVRPILWPFEWPTILVNKTKKIVVLEISHAIQILKLWQKKNRFWVSNGIFFFLLATFDISISIRFFYFQFFFLNCLKSF